MSEFKSSKCIKAAHKAPSLIERRRRPRIAYRDFPASFVTQVMTERDRNAGQPTYINPPRNAAVEAYRSGARVAVKRLPAGASHAEIA